MGFLGKFSLSGVHCFKSLIAKGKGVSVSSSDSSSPATAGQHHNGLDQQLPDIRVKSCPVVHQDYLDGLPLSVQNVRLWASLPNLGAQDLKRKARKQAISFRRLKYRRLLGDFFFFLIWVGTTF